MPPTFKDSSTTLPASPEKREGFAETSSAAEEIPSAQPVALEVPVTVNGARAVEGTDQRETFSEKTNTVLVLPKGAVIRLSSPVAPGQLLFLTNEKTRKEVVCQVVKSKNYRSVSGYVELEFTEPVLGFWGMRFPGDRHGLQSSTAPLAERKSDSTLSSGEITPKSVVPKPDSTVEVKPAAETVTANFVPAAEEFKTEIKLDSRPQNKADLLSPAEPSIDGLKLEANRLQEQLSALLFAERQQSEANAPVSVVPASKPELGDAAAKSFEMASEERSAVKPPTLPAKSDSPSSVNAAPKSTPVTVTSGLDDEQVKIPAWLEPLARNANIPAPPAEKGADDFVTPSEHDKAKEVPESVSAAKEATVAPKKPAPAKPAPAAPIFGNSLLGESMPAPAGRRGKSKGIWMAIAAALIAATGSGVWYFRDSLASLAPSHTAARSNASSDSAISALRPDAPSVNSAAAPVTPSLTPDTSSPSAKSNSATTVSEAPARVSTPDEGKVQTAAITERIPKSSSSNDVVLPTATADESLEPEVKKPSLGTVRLAKPKLTRTGRQANGEMEPVFEAGNGALAPGDSSLGANFAEGSKQPTAPEGTLQVGGDVKPARMISSVQPVYPALAKSQHVAGDVRVDALIDATGRVTTMKVVSGPILLHQAAMDALHQWKYQPATLDGRPVAMHLTVTIQFRLQ
jgi:TonB family protein